MKIVTGLLLLVSSVVFISSCQKEISPTVLTTSNDTALLKLVVYLDSTKPAGIDTMFKATYSYDSQDRLVHSVQLEYTPGIFSFTYDFSYTGNSKYPFKQVTVQDGQQPFLRYPSYNGSNEVVRDSFFSSVTPNTVTIQSFSTRLGGYLMVFKQKDLMTGTVIDRDSILYHRVITAGNIMSGIDSNYHPALGLSTVNYAYRYDNKINPFLSIVNVYPYLGFYFFSGDGYILPIGRNNATSFSEIYRDATSSDQTSGTISYNYNSDALPVAGKITGILGVNKVVFSYY